MSKPAPDWSALITELESFPREVAARGRSFADEGRVSDVAPAGPRAYDARVRDTRRVAVHWEQVRRTWTHRCTCDVRGACAHAFAAACLLLRAAEREGWHDPRFARVWPGARPRPTLTRPRRAGPMRSAAPASPALRALARLREATAASERWFALREFLGEITDTFELSESEFRAVLDEPDGELRLMRLARDLAERGLHPTELAPWRDRPDLLARLRAAAQTKLERSLDRWALDHAHKPQRVVRAELGLVPAPDGAAVTLTARVGSGGGPGEVRSGWQLQQLLGEARRQPGLLTPPQHRLLQLLVETLAARGGGGPARLATSALSQLLDRFPDSALVTWAADLPADLASRAGVAPGSRVRLADDGVAMTPALEREADGARLVLALAWPDGTRRELGGTLVFAADEREAAFHPSLVLADGVFHRLQEEPPRQLRRLFEEAGGLPITPERATRLLADLAAGFDNVRASLAAYTRVHDVRPVAELTLDAQDVFEIRVWAVSGDDDWRPGRALADEASLFEYTRDGRWVRMPASAASGADLELPSEREGLAEAAADVAPRPEPAPDPAPEDVWLEYPDPAQVGPLLGWLAELPVARGGRRAGVAEVAGAWTLRLTERTAAALLSAWDDRPTGVQWWGDRSAQRFLEGGRLVRPSVRVESSGADWWSVSVEWEAEGLALSEADVAKLRASRDKVVRLSSGWVRRDAADAHDAWADTLADLGLETSAAAQRVTVAQLAQAKRENLERLESLASGAETREAIRRLRRAIDEFSGLPRIDVPAGFTAELRHYQHDGLDFLVWTGAMGLGAVLADDMGLGKTVQTLAWLQHLRNTGPDGGPALVVCPASVVHNWQREAERFTPGLRVLALTSGADRHAQRGTIARYDVVLTNYALLRRDHAAWAGLELRALVLDEAQNVKNPDAAISKVVRTLKARHRVALTGTPLENRALDLWSIVSCVHAGYLGPRGAFSARHDRPDAPGWTRRLLAARLRPLLLRRLKSQVAQELPPRIEERRDCDMTTGQRKLYLAELLRTRELVAGVTDEGAFQARRFEILAGLTRLRQICCHPALAGGREDLGSGKFDELFALLEPLLAEGHKVLVFSQFVECLKRLQTELRARGMKHHMLTGATTKREQVVNAFADDETPCVFLVSLKAGGTGLNLTAASYVVLFDPWWNPAVEAQAIDRTHRIGQTRTVIAYRLLTEGTIEERIWELQQRKSALAKGLLDEDRFARTLSRDDLQYLLAES